MYQYWWYILTHIMKISCNCWKIHLMCGLLLSRTLASALAAEVDSCSFVDGWAFPFFGGSFHIPKEPSSLSPVLRPLLTCVDKLYRGGVWKKVQILKQKAYFSYCSKISYFYDAGILYIYGQYTNCGIWLLFLSFRFMEERKMI